MKREPKWISKVLALAIHDRLLIEHGGLAGFRDEGLLDSALSAPQHHFHYGEKNTIVLAASYANSIIRNHPFNDGNKRVAFVAAVTFLERNGFRFTAAESDAVAMTLRLATKDISESEFAAWLKANSRRSRSRKIQ